MENKIYNSEGADDSKDELRNEENIINPKITDMKESGASTLKKMQTYLFIIMGVIIFLYLVYKTVVTIFGSSKENEVKKEEIAATIVKPLSKELPIKENPKDEFLNSIEDLKTNKQFEIIKESGETFTTNLKPPMFKQMIVKGESEVLIKNSNPNDEYNRQIEELKNEQNKNNDLQSDSSDLYSGDTFAPSIAKISQFNPDFLLPKGSYIGCSLDTRFVSNLSGSTSCTVSQNIYSSNGNILLIERGSKLFGTFKGGDANDGASRYFVIWQEIRTPNHLRIPLNSGASDELGGAGLEGEIDHKWMMRFGSSILLSAVDDVFNVLAWKLTNKNNGNSSRNQIDYSENTRENASNMANIALEKFINIKPTIYKQHGDLVGAYVNRDIDFSKVYKLKKKI